MIKPGILRIIKFKRKNTKEMMSIGKSSGVNPRMFVTPEVKVGLQVICIEGNWETMGLTAMSISILEIAMLLSITKVCKATRMLSPLELLPKTIFCEKSKGFRGPLKNFGTKSTRWDRNTVFKK